MKKNDIVLLVTVLIMAAGLFFGVKIYGKLSTTENPVAVIKVDGKEYKRIDLLTDETIKIENDNGGYNVLKISERKADIIDASCPDKLCVHQKPAEYRGENLVCLPNKVTVEIENGKDSGIDAVTN